MTTFTIKSFRIGGNGTEKEIAKSELKVEGRGWNLFNFNKKGQPVSRIEMAPVKEPNKILESVKSAGKSTLESISNAAKSDIANATYLGVAEGAGALIGSYCANFLLNRLFPEPVKEEKVTVKQETVKVDDSELKSLKAQVADLTTKVTDLTEGMKVTDEAVNTLFESFDKNELQMKSMDEKLETILSFVSPTTKPVIETKPAPENKNPLINDNKTTLMKA